MKSHLHFVGDGTCGVPVNERDHVIGIQIESIAVIQQKRFAEDRQDAIHSRHVVRKRGTPACRMVRAGVDIASEATMAHTLTVMGMFGITGLVLCTTVENPSWRMIITAMTQ